MSTCAVHRDDGLTLSGRIDVVRRRGRKVLVIDGRPLSEYIERLQLDGESVRLHVVVCDVDEGD